MRRLAAIVLAGFIGVGCERVEDAPEPALQETVPQEPAAAAPQPVEVQLLNAQGTQVGTARVTQQGDSAEMRVSVRGLAPGEHGIHFHETPECTPPSFESAGGHFNPSNAQHGLENPQGPHAGDLPNLTVGADSTAEQVFRIAHPRTGGMPMGDTAHAMGDTTHVMGDSAVMSGDMAAAHGGGGGLALMIHAGRDDQRTDPSGNSGDRVACGVVRIQ